MYYLLETPVGMALFKQNETVALVSKLDYPDIAASIEAVKALGSVSRETELPAYIDRKSVV